MSAKTIARLIEERNEWRREHPFGFVAKPERNNDGSWNYLVWECAIPGKKGSIWQRGIYKLTMYFPGNYPFSPPLCKFEKPIYHPNVGAAGYVSIPSLDTCKDWRPSFKIKTILLELQDMLTRVAPNYVVDNNSFEVFKRDIYLYEAKVLLNAYESFAKWNLSII